MPRVWLKVTRIEGRRKMSYEIISNNSLHNKLTLSSRVINDNNIQVPGEIRVKVGARWKEVKVFSDKSLKENEIKISSDLVNFFLLPLDIPYDISFENGEMHIGPIIGLLLAHKAELLSKKRLKKFCSYTSKYERINGMVYVFSLDGIDMDQKTITGYYYQPHVPKGELPWKEAIFPYPDVIFRRPHIPKPVYKHLKSEMGDKIINYPWFDKKQTAQWLEKDPLLTPYLPETRLLYSSHDLDDMLHLYHMVFLKPVNSGLGDGIVAVTRKKKGDYFKYRPDLKGKTTETIVCVNKGELALMVDKIVAQEPYIVQQGIPVLTYEGRKIVFRVIMQKDASKEWKCTGIVALLGHAGGLDSHSYYYGIQMPFNETLEKTGKLPADVIKEIEEEIVYLCTRSCGTLDCYGSGIYGDLGLDIVLDASYHPWLIEINVLHEYEVPLYIHDKRMYKTMKIRILDYAKSLAGFYEEGEGR